VLWTEEFLQPSEKEVLKLQGLSRVHAIDWERSCHNGIEEV
jgi:hypothetical protein